MPLRLDTGERRRPAITSGPADAMIASVLVLIAPDRLTDDGGAADLERRAGDAHPPADLGSAGGASPPSESEAEVILIERAPRGHHPGEISLPGGRAEEGEEPEATALREAAEEVALDPLAAGVSVVGRLEPFWIPVSGYRVIPVVAIAHRRPDLRPSPDEVASIIRAPLRAFLPNAAIEIVETTIRDVPIRYGAYPIGEHLVWGATARILGQLGAVLG